MARSGGQVWLRGESGNGELPEALVHLPAGKIYWLADAERLVEVDSAVPVERLPEDLEWELLDEVTRPVPGRQALPAELTGQCPVWPTRDETLREPNLLRTNLAALVDWVSKTAQVRLAPLRFAACADGEVLVHGSPLPSLPGERLVEADGVASLAGWTWDPPVSAKILAVAFQLAPEDLVVLHRNGTWERIEAANFVPVSRAAVRLTQLQFDQPE